jgi:phosphoribosyl 1,2-cyclic phosphodiesterase
MITFIPYASSSSGNLYTVTDGKTTIMLECGLPWRKVRELLNFKTSDISGICLTHSHLDHAKGAKDAAKAGLDVYASGNTFDSLGLSGHRFIEVEPNQKFIIGTWKILPFSTIHDCEGSLGFLMENEEREAFLFLTDSMYSVAKFPALSVIAIECNNLEGTLSDNISSGHIPATVGRRIRHSHMSLQTLIKMLKASDVSKCRHIYLLHLSDSNSDEAKMIKAVHEATGIPCTACLE